MAVVDARGSSRLDASSLHLLVGVVAVAGAAAGFLAIRFGGDQPIIASTLPGWQLGAALVGLACLAEVAYVRLRHGDSTEDLTFFEAVVVAAALLLPVGEALAAALGGLALASLIVRRPLVKMVFNLGAYAAAASFLLLLAHLTAGSSGTLGVRAVLGIVAGTLVFAAVNLVALAAVLAVIEGGEVRNILALEWPLSAIMAVGNAGAGMMAVEIGLSVPALLPFVALPVLTLGHSYRSAVQRAAEQERNRWLAALGVVLAGQPDGGLLLPTAETARGLFDAAQAHIVLLPDVGDSSAPNAVLADVTGARLHVPDARLCALVEVLGDGGGARVVPRDLLPDGCRRAIAVGLDLGPQARGALVVGWNEQGTRVAQRLRRSGEPVDAPRSMLVAVATAVSNAIRAADHLRALVEETGKLQAVVNHGTDGVAVVTVQGDLLVWSPAMTRLTGVDARTAGGAGATIVRDDTSSDPVTRLLAGLADPTAGPVHVDRSLPAGYEQATVVIPVRLDNDEKRDLEISVARIAHGSLTGELTVLTARDITEAGRLERLKADFIASVSHELRTPITPIKGYAQLLAARGHLMEPSRRLHALQLIEDRADHLSRLVDDLLLASSVGGGETPKITIEPVEVDLRTIIEKSIAGSELLVDRTSSHRPDHPVHVWCDAVRATQCLSNLLSNAVKYSPAHTPIVVEVSESAGSASVSVTDRGRGIPSAELDRVFERFHRVDDAFTMQTSGSGLGLYIARELARAMGGDLTLVSRFGHGSTLTLTLPRPAADPVATNTPIARQVREEALR